MNIRLMRDGEYDDFLGLMEVSYGKPKGFFQVHDPHILGRANLGQNNVFLIEEQSRLVAALGLFRLDMIQGGVSVVMGGVGAICTLPEYRGRGCMAFLIKHAFDFMRDKSMPISVLWGDRHRYRSFGYEFAGRVLCFTITERGLARSGIVGSGVAVWDGRADVFRAMRNAYDQMSYRCIHDDVSFRARFTPFGISVYYAGKGDKFGYLAIKEKSVKVLEYAGSPETVMTIARHCLGALAVKSLDFLWPASMPLPEQYALAFSQCSIIPTGMACVLDVHRVWELFDGCQSKISMIRRDQAAELGGTSAVVSLFGCVDAPYNLFIPLLDRV